VNELGNRVLNLLPLNDLSLSMSVRVYERESEEKGRKERTHEE